MARDLESLSDEELLALHQKEVGDDGLENLSDDELIKLHAQEVQKPKEESPGVGRTVLDKGLQGAAFGMLPQVSGLVDAGVMKAQQYLQNSDLEKQGFKIQEPGFEDEYVAGRDRTTKRLQAESRAHPGVSAVSEAGGAIGSALLGAGAVGAPAGLLKTMGMGAVAGGAYAPETPIGEKPLENIEGNLKARGAQAAAGGLLSGALYGVGKGISKIRNIGKPEKAIEALESEAIEEAAPKFSPDVEAINATKEKMLPPTTVAELRNNLAGLPRDLLDRPARAAMLQAEKDLPFSPILPLTKVDEAILSNKAKGRTIKALQERPETYELFSQQNQMRKNQVSQAIDKFAAKIAGSKDRPSTRMQAGQEFLDSMSAGYEGVKKKLGPKFEAIHQMPIDQGKLRSGVESIVKDMDKKATVFERGVLKDALKKLSEPDISLKKIQDVRELLRNSVDPVKPGQFAGTRELRSRLLDLMDNEAFNLAKKGGMDAPSVRETFKGWAQNERFRDKIEDLIGADLRDTIASSPDKVFDGVFKNVATVRQLKQELGPEKVRELAGSLIATMKGGATKETGDLMSAKFASLIRSKENVLSQVLDATELKQLKALAAYNRGIEELAASMNPSGTAAALEAISARELKEGWGRPLHKAMDSTLGAADRAFQRRAAQSEIDSLLRGRKRPEVQGKGLLNPGASGLLPAGLRPSTQNKGK